MTRRGPAAATVLVAALALPVFPALADPTDRQPPADRQPEASAGAGTAFAAELRVQELRQQLRAASQELTRAWLAGLPAGPQQAGLAAGIGDELERLLAGTEPATVVALGDEVIATLVEVQTALARVKDDAARAAAADRQAVRAASGPGDPALEELRAAADASRLQATLILRSASETAAGAWRRQLVLLDGIEPGLAAEARRRLALTRIERLSSWTAALAATKEKSATSEVAAIADAVGQLWPVLLGPDGTPWNDGVAAAAARRLLDLRRLLAQTGNPGKLNGQAHNRLGPAGARNLLDSVNDLLDRLPQAPNDVTPPVGGPADDDTLEGLRRATVAVSTRTRQGKVNRTAAEGLARWIDAALWSPNGEAATDPETISEALLIFDAAADQVRRSAETEGAELDAIWAWHQLTTRIPDQLLRLRSAAPANAVPLSVLLAGRRADRLSDQIDQLAAASSWTRPELATTARLVAAISPGPGEPPDERAASELMRLRALLLRREGPDRRADELLSQIRTSLAERPAPLEARLRGIQSAIGEALGTDTATTIAELDAIHAQLRSVLATTPEAELLAEAGLVADTATGLSAALAGLTDELADRLARTRRAVGTDPSTALAAELRELVLQHRAMLAAARRSKANPRRSLARLTAVAGSPQLRAPIRARLVAQITDRLQRRAGELLATSEPAPEEVQAMSGAIVDLSGVLDRRHRQPEDDAAIELLAKLQDALGTPTRSGPDPLRKVRWALVRRIRTGPDSAAEEPSTTAGADLAATRAAEGTAPVASDEPGAPAEPLTQTPEAMEAPAPAVPGSPATAPVAFLPAVPVIEEVPPVVVSDLRPPVPPAPPVIGTEADQAGTGQPAEPEPSLSTGIAQLSGVGVGVGVNGMATPAFVTGQAPGRDGR